MTADTADRTAPGSVRQPGRRERRKQATRAALSEAALRLCAERGVQNVTVEQITDEADVAVRTFFNYFSCKEEAVVAVDTAVADAIVTAFRDRPPAEPLLEAFRRAVLEVLDREFPSADRMAAEVRDRHRRFGALLRAPALLPHRVAAYAARERAMADAVASRMGAARTGAAVDDLYPAVIAAAVISAMRVVAQHWVHADPAAPASLADLVDRMVDALGALAGPHAR